MDIIATSFASLNPSFEFRYFSINPKNPGKHAKSKGDHRWIYIEGHFHLQDEPGEDFDIGLMVMPSPKIND
jgi:hypothetical protein